MSDSLFFIDTNPEEVSSVKTKKDKIPKEKKREKKEKTNHFKKSKEEERKKRKQEEEEKEENLSTFLFGNQTSKKDEDVVKEESTFAGDDKHLAKMLKKAKKIEKKRKEEEERKKTAELKKIEKKKEAAKKPKVEILKSDGNSDSEEGDEEASNGDNDNQNEAEIKDSTNFSENWAELEQENDDVTAADSDSGGEGSSDDEGNDGNVNVFDMIPQDTFGKNLNLAGNRKRKAAWQDEADEQVLVKDKINSKSHKEIQEKKKMSTEQYTTAVQRKFKSVVGEPAWASLDNKDKDEQDSDDEFFQETTDLVERRGTSTRLPQGQIDVKECTAMNNPKEDGYVGTMVGCVDFHPTSTVGLVASRTGNVTLMQIDGKHNPKIQNIYFRNSGVETAKFSVDGKEVVVGSINDKFFHVFDMIAGKINKIKLEKRELGVLDSGSFELSPDGKIIAFKGHTGAIQLYSATTKEYITNLQMNDNCQALAFSKSGRKLYTYGDGGEFYVWDMNSRTCESKLVDDGCITGKSLAVNSNYLACGSQEGVVNIYSLNKLSGMKTGYPKPDKSILNITSAITNLRFNPTGEILAISSNQKQNVLKLLHFPSMTIFENEIVPEYKGSWTCYGAEFSPGGGYMGLGTNVGKGLLYRLQHYKDY